MIGRRFSAGRVAALAILVATTACRPADIAGKPTAAEKLAADQQLLKDPAQSERELKRRLASVMQVQDGFLFLHDPILGDLDIAVMPTSAFWVLHCGIVGIWIDFGGVRGGDEDSAGMFITLTEAHVDEKACARLAPALAQAIEARLKTQNASN